ncbi:hypothetical protein JOD54_001566 [Actinokineospora baliensis]|uniref:hypothetical protein n=1 Tax=Actinokineospora baliensis TaxID=547056 RepID=UPI00195A88BF|nr:hypothetical protein [Actinokineospora baliensis]MBM7771362.1 hypothetical protein [Actinokineospora baliensis]
MTTTLLEHCLIRSLRELHLPPDDYVVFGSAPLLAHGLCGEVRDLDIVVRDSLWCQISSYGKAARGEITGDPVRTVCDGRIQFSQRWVSADWDTDDLIERADLIAGIRFASLSDVLAYKRSLNRPKDRQDIATLIMHGS